MLSYVAALLFWAPLQNVQSVATEPPVAHVTSAAAEFQHAIDGISADSLRGNLSFLSSDVLAGRWTPSPGLDVAAEFIASRFRAAGLEPGNGPSYFQIADLTDVARKSAELRDRKIGQPIIARNVVGLLRGSDPELANTYVIVSAHYDHLGTLETAGRLGVDKVASKDGDRIFNGANDDGSGTVSVIEIASALARMKNRPKRSIIFVAFCGEELGELGSLYYTQHPLFPLNQTVAEINLEQVGRSDSDLGKERVTLTGYDYTSITPIIQNAARISGLVLIRTDQTDGYFQASDNYSFARAGIPDLTIATSYEFPDYHRLKDEWQKIDFPEMVKVDRLATRVVWALANDANRPHWNLQNAKAAKYREAAGGR